MDLTPEAMANNFAYLSTAIAKKADEIRKLDQDFTIANHDYKKSLRLAFLSADQGEQKLSNDMKRYIAENATQEKELEVAKLEVDLRAAKEEMRVLRDRLEIGRSMSAIMRMEWSVS